MKQGRGQAEAEEEAVAEAAEKERVVLLEEVQWVVGLEELREGDEEEGGEADRRGGLRVEGVDLVAQPGGEGGVFDLGEARAVDVPYAPLGDVS